MFTCASLKCARYYYHLYDLSQKKAVGSCIRLCCICGFICRPAGYCLNTSTALQMSALLTFLCQRKERQSCQLNAMLQCNLTESRVELPPPNSNIQRQQQLYNERSIIIIMCHERCVTGVVTLIVLAFFFFTASGDGRFTGHDHRVSNVKWQLINL